VDPKKLNIPDYYDTIILPMDLGTVEKRLYNQNYNNMSDFANDIRLIWSNAETFNGPTNDVTIAARQLRDLFEKSFQVKETGWRESIPCTKRRLKSRPSIFKRVFKHCSIQSPLPPEDSPPLPSDPPLDDMKPTVPELPENPPDILPLLENTIPCLSDHAPDIILPSLENAIAELPPGNLRNSEISGDMKSGEENMTELTTMENSSSILDQAPDLLDPTLPTGVNV
jgi:hypothetical protein